MYDEFKEDITEIKSDVKEIHNRLFMGNGQSSIIVQLDRLNTFKKIVTWFMSVCIITLLGFIVRWTLK